MTQKLNARPGLSTHTLEVLSAFLRLGCTSFGGPVAHLGYFRKELIEKRRWCSEEVFAEIVAVSQSLPGPASSQVAFSLGLLKGGWPGGLAAWVGFTLPSAALMTWFALSTYSFHGKVEMAVLHGLQISAVAVVAQAVLGMRKSLAPDALRLGIAALSFLTAILTPASASTILAILVGAICGGTFLESSELHASGLRIGPARNHGLVAGGLFGSLLILASVLPRDHPGLLEVAASCYLSGALVFGGGHVVLPLLDHAFVTTGWVSAQTFLAGYGATQAIPGPLFTFAAFLGGAVQSGVSRTATAFVALVAIFLPGLLLMVTALAFWSELRRSPVIQRTLRGVNAGVVGVLAAAFLRPICSTALSSALDGVLAAVALALLTFMRVRPILVVLLAVLVEVLITR